MAGPVVHDSQPGQPAASVPPPMPQPPPPQPMPSAEGAGQQESPAPAPEAGGTRVFSNKDLRRYTRVKEEFGLGRDVVTVDLTPSTPETADQAVAGMTTAERDQEMRETMKKINELNAEAAYLKSRIPSLHNPFLARVPLSETDATAEAGMDNAQRLDRVKERLSRVDQELDQLQRRLAELHQPESGQETP